VPASRLSAERPNQAWALDIQYDQAAEGRIVKLMHVVDEFTRDALEMKCERRIDADSTVATLDELVVLRG
jgi:putative transposase